ncbi:MAG: hypothetical protein KF687_13980 [Cyclobacteriaceae bacterium]|nr:hypothetical protein [Cyclobacteriaceae bacterium]
MKYSLFIGFMLLLAACTALENAELTERSTFIKLYNGIYGIEASAAELTDDGYIVLGNMTITRDSVLTVVFKTDKRGNRTTPIHYYQGGSGNAIKPMPGNNGYLIVGEKIKTNPNATPTDNIDITSAHILHIGNDLDSLRTIYLRDTSMNEVKVDYRATTLTITPSNKIIILGTYQRSLADPEKPFIQQYNINLTEPEWRDDGESVTRSYRNAKSVHYNPNNGNILYASAVALQQQNFTNSWISINQIPQGSALNAVDLFGSDTEQSFIPADIQPGNSGFGLIATRSNTDGTNANIFFARVDVTGRVQPMSIKFYDTVTGETNETQSQIQDYGTAIAATKSSDFILAGHFQTSVTLGIGNGGNDILLIRIDQFGNLIWKKTIGGTGSETVSTIRETDDMGILICGTNTVNGVSSIFLIKTDINGDLKN